MSGSNEKYQKSRIWQLRIGERRVLLIAGDFLMAVMALFISLYFWATSEKFFGFSIEFLQRRVPAWFFFIPFVWLILMIEMYDVNKAGDWIKTIRSILIAAIVGLILYLLLFFYYVDSPNSLLPRRGIASYLITVVLLTLIWRALYIRVFHAPQFMRRVLLVGGGESGRLILQVINNLKSKPFHVVGIVDDAPEKSGAMIEGYKVLGGGQDLLNIINDRNISDIFVAITNEMGGGMFQALLDAQESGIEITRMAVAYEELLGRVPIQTLEANWILRSFVDETRVNTFFELGKRLVDIIGGLFGSLVTLLILPFVTIAILLDDGRPVFYLQTRSGRNGRTYRIVKFRTMVRDAEADGQPKWASVGDERNTRVGHVLRKTHLDELPQFINVLIGDMSLVGPRAERPELITLFQGQVPFYRARLLVKPGITGWAQINFGYASTVEETMVKLEYDLYYIKNRNLFMDVVILLRTPATVLGFRGR
jgi:exopolysaccharide biosynthesis polyprenyl glycosylphosphotransferase